MQFLYTILVPLCWGGSALEVEDGIKGKYEEMIV
jgi:hypothetical protein